jgi:hypothetical protein
MPPTKPSRRRKAMRPRQAVTLGPPTALARPLLYNRTPTVNNAVLEYFLTDFIQLNDWNDLDAFMVEGRTLRNWFERRTGWQLVLSGYCSSDNVCRDDHGRQILNLWRIASNSLDSIPKGLSRLLTDESSKGKIAGAGFSRLLDLFQVEHHFITRSDGALASTPTVWPELRMPGYVPAFVYVEYWTTYEAGGADYSFTSDFTGDADRDPPEPSNLPIFPAPWQFVANVRAISGRVNTYSQYWLRMIPEDADHSIVTQMIRREVMHAAWYRQRYRPLRVDLLTPTDYDPTQYPR